MNRLSRILVAVDGSEGSDKAFKAAVELARKFSAKLYAICVVDLPSMLGAEKEVMLTLEANLKRQATVLLAGYRDEAKKEGMEIETILARGYPSRAIIEVAKTNDINIIVIGTRGLSGIKGLFLGSVSHEVVRSANQPVLVIR